MLIGYARVSTDDQILNLQHDVLEKADCERMFEDIAVDAKAERVGWTALLSNLRRGDTVMILCLDRFGRSLKDLIRLVEQPDAAGVGLRSLQESIDAASSDGGLVFQLFDALAEFELNLIRERTQAGLSSVASFRASCRRSASNGSCRQGWHTPRRAQKARESGSFAL